MNLPMRKKPDEVIEAEMGLAPIAQNQVTAIQPHVQLATPEQSRIESVNSLLAKAYDRASLLELTKDEAEKLTADFDDADFRRGAAGKEDLLYIEHQSLRRRLNAVLGVGKWSLIVRRSWSESFMAGRPPEPAVRVYTECVLIARGCFIAEAIGDGNYFTKNASQNYGDAFEASKSAALRRCCKDMGIGLQAWSKEFTEAWKAKYPGFNRPTK